MAMPRARQGPCPQSEAQPRTAEGAAGGTRWSRPESHGQPRHGHRTASEARPLPHGLGALVQCLHRYVEANPSRFLTREEQCGDRKIVTFIAAEENTQDENRILRAV
jgi:hypothetical protein